MTLTSGRLLEMLGGTPGLAGVTITPETAPRLTAVYRSISLIASTIAQFPLRTYRHQGVQEMPELVPSPAYLGQPNDDDTAMEFWERAVAHLLSRGNAYLYKERDNGGAIRNLVLVHPANVDVRAEDGHKVFSVQSASGRRDDYTAREVLHIPALGYDGLTGLSPIGLAKGVLETLAATEQYAAKLFGSGALATGVLSVDRRLQKNDVEEIKARWREQYGGSQNAHGVMVLDKGTQFDPISIPPEHAQFLESRNFGVQEVGRLFGVPLDLLMLPAAGAGGRALAEYNAQFVIYTLGSWMARIAARVSMDINRGGLTVRGQYVEHDAAALLRGDVLTRYRAYQLAITSGWMKRSEPRQVEGLRTTPEEAEALGFVDPKGAGSSSGEATGGGNPTGPDPADPVVDDEGTNEEKGAMLDRAFLPGGPLDRPLGRA